MKQRWILFFCNLYIVFLVPVPSSAEAEFTYNDVNEWGKLYKTCSEGDQSPINLKKSDATQMENVKLKFKNHNVTPSNASLTNTGDTLVLRYFYNENTPELESDFLGGSFVFDKFVYYWGTSDTDGSEHAIEGKKYAAELVYFSYDSSFKSYDDAYKQNGRIVAISYFLEFEDIIGGPMENKSSTFKRVVDIGSTYYLTNEEILHSENLDFSLKDFYSYIGSETSPPCRQNVFRIVRERPIKFPAKVLDVFRRIKLRGGTKSNVRPLQPSTAKVSYVITKEESRK